MVEYIMKKEICGTFHAKCGTRVLTQVFGTVPLQAGRVVTLSATYIKNTKQCFAQLQKYCNFEIVFLGNYAPAPFL
jgi:hypothetical protein